MDQVTLFQSEDNRVRVEVRFEYENLWLSHKLMAQFFKCSTDNISHCLTIRLWELSNS